MSDTLVVDVPMTREEARAAVEAIKSHIREARALLLDLHEREGWLALGYSSWEECVTEEFGHSRSYMYRQLAAAKLELGVGSEVGHHPESHMRAINETLEDDGQKLEAYRLAVASDATSAAEYRRAAMEVWLKRNLPETSVVATRAKTGMLSTLDAYRIGHLYTDDSLPPIVREAIGFCTDPELAEMLPHVYLALPDLWGEIENAGSLPGIEENIPLGEATARDLKSYLTLDSAERRAQHVERNREYYDERNELIEEVIYGARVMSVLLEHDLCRVAKKVASSVNDLVCVLDNMEL